MPQRVCDDLQRTLASGMELQQGDQWRPLHPGDLAVLVGRNREAVALQRELQRRGIPRALAGEAISGRALRPPASASGSRALNAREIAAQQLP